MKGRGSYDPIRERAQTISNILWERAMKLADILAPEYPADHEPIDDRRQWLILERLAQSLSPESWDDPDAITDLYRLRQRFAPNLAYSWLPEMARRKREAKKMLPRADITPANPQYEAMIRRLKS